MLQLVKVRGEREKTENQQKTPAKDENLRERKYTEIGDRATAEEAKSRSVPLPKRAWEGLDTKTQDAAKETISITNRNKDRIDILWPLVFPHRVLVYCTHTVLYI